MVTTSFEKAGEYLLEGKVGLVPTDTIYGISSVISERDLVERIYEIKQRDRSKPFIILIPDKDALIKFGISEELIAKTSKYWPGRNTLIFELENQSVCEKYLYLHRGKNSLGFRVPDIPELVGLLEAVGPIVSTSANISTSKHVTSVEEAKRVFGGTLDFYLDVGELEGSPSSVYKFVDGSITVLRE